MHKKAILFTVLTVLMLSLISCSTPQKKFKTDLVGQWKRVGDNAAGIVVKVEQINNEDSYIGRAVSIPSNVSYYAKPGEILWQSIVPQSSNQWQGLISQRGQTFLGDTITETKNAQLLLVNNDLLEIYIDASIVKYIRIYTQ